MRAGFVLGLGLGGFIDGIVFHQVLQWHHLLCYTCHPEATAAEVRQNVFWDGVFHVFTLVLTIAGVLMLGRAAQEDRARQPLRLLAGAMLVGRGTFNVVEGLINHQFLGIHHVRPGPNQVSWDVGFLAFGVGLIVTGRLIGRISRPAQWG